MPFVAIKCHTTLVSVRKKSLPNIALGRLGFLVDQFVVLGAEARQSDAIAVAPLGYDVENIKFWFLIISHNRNSI